MSTLPLDQRYISCDDAARDLALSPEELKRLLEERGISQSVRGWINLLSFNCLREKHALKNGVALNTTPGGTANPQRLDPRPLEEQIAEAVAAIREQDKAGTVDPPHRNRRRMRSALRIDAEGYQLHRAGPGTWRVTAPSGATYTTEPQEGRCSCPGGLRSSRRACKHLTFMWGLLRLCPGLEDAA